MSPRYPLNPRTGRREPPPFEGMGTALFEMIACLVLGFVVITLMAAMLYGCVALWTLMLSGGH
jgi:hypothetical protein